MRTLAALSLALASCLAGAAADLEKVGEARLRYFFWDVYESRLYCPDGRYRPGIRPLRLEIEYLLPVSADRLVGRTAREWDTIGMRDPRREDWLATLRQLWPDVGKHDVLAVELSPGGESTFFLNGRRLGAITEPAFGQRFVDIWLSPDTSRPALRLALTGGRDG